MLALVHLVLLVSGICLIVGKPAGLLGNGDGSMDESLYENDDNEEVNEDTSSNAEEPSPLKAEDNMEVTDSNLRNQRVVDFSGNTYLQRTAEERLARANDDNISGKQKYGNRDLLDEKMNDPVDISKIAPQSLSKRGMFNKCLNKISNSKTDQNTDNNRFPGNALGDEYLNENNKISIDQIGSLKNTDINNFNENEVFDSNRQTGYKMKNIIDNDTKRSSVDIKKSRESYDSEQESIYRQRRDVPEKKEDLSETNTSNVGKSNDDSLENEDEETAIKKHIKRLSEDELNDLFKSLPEYKRDLLKKIIDSDNTDVAGSVIKRDITKKAGAVEENNLNDNNQLESNKVQGETSGDLNTDSPVTHRLNEKKDTMKQELNDTSDTTTSKDDATTSNNLSSKLSDTLSVESGTTTNNNQVIKKRDIYDSRNEQYDSKESALTLNSDSPHRSEQEYYGSPSEEITNLMAYESQLHDNKREAYYDSNAELSDSMKSLQESFPNSNSYEDNTLNMAPLVRVKRDKGDLTTIEKAEDLMADSKVSYFPYRAENDDEDNGEGNEFDDDVFYDRTSNLAKDKKDTHSENVLNNGIKDPLDNDVALGSDTDNILANVEEADFTCNTGSRSRRSSKTNLEPTSTSLEPHNTKQLQTLDSRGNYPVYQEKNALSPLQVNIEDGFNRYKRVRNVEQE